MRVTSNAQYRNFTRSVNDVHGKLNKSMNRVSSGAAYETAAENPLAYYEGKKLDNQYQDAVSKHDLITDLKGRFEQQEDGALTIQDLLSKGKNKVQYIRNDTNNASEKIIDSTRSDLMEKAQSMANALNAQYEDFYVFGGNDVTTSPFSLSADCMTLTYSHTFPGKSEKTTITMKLEWDDTKKDYAYNLGEEDLKKIKTAMREQGHVDIGYGTIRDHDTLLDTYTGGLNLLTGINSDSMNMAGGVSDDDLMKALNNNPIALLGKAIATMGSYTKGDITKSDYSERLGNVIDSITETEHNVSTVYSDLGNKYALLEDTESRLTDLELSLQTQYKEKLGADPYEAITSMYSYQYSYNAALQVGSRMMQSSLFDFMR